VLNAFYWRRTISAALLIGAFGCGGGGGGGGNAASTTPALTTGQPTSGLPTSTTTPVYQTPYPYVDVLHTRLTFDASRNRIYAYVPSADSSHPNSFAVIDVDTRTVSYTSSVSFVPWTMTVSSDGRYLYVGTAYTHEVIRLTLPDFAIDLRVALGSDAALFNPQGHQFDAGNVAVSPTDAQSFAVSLIDQTYWSCAIGVRVYTNAAVTAQQYATVSTSIGDTVAWDADGVGLTTLCSGGTPDGVARFNYAGGSLTFTAGSGGHGTMAATLAVLPNVVLDGSGSVFDMPGLVLRGTLRPLTLFQQGDPAPLMHACTFADDLGSTAACLSHTDTTDGFPTFRAFVIYELTNATPLRAIPLDLSVSWMTSRIFRTGPGRFAVSVGSSDQNRMLLAPSMYITQNTRIYFLSL